jgi:hypothetical protein
MTEKLWIIKCAAQFRKVYPSIGISDASDLAEMCFEDANGDLTEVPEDCADDEMSEWGE